ncbi:Ohr subfamily peroxiredoxin [Fontibacillus phaseoli]|uniref:Ohr subfamily peroxiredoxin n=1 Tax=Fontibacillus phaseoli TaxID=1416533 RepID=A0A369BIN5_9BACL|nr:organic hydroperoxide resistance protein [Fontibacillus phaseoli]RCX20436.1 Ohr subfamily peroxiredoxin [Fontibacillus phaseoli]
MEKLYTATATVKGGRTGTVATSDGVLNLELSMPESLGGEGGSGTNPEQLFAAGYGACFASALANVAEKAGVQADQSEVTHHVSIGKDDSDGGFRLSVEIDVKLPGVERSKAQELLHQAHEFCPYSKATRGNIVVKLNLVE